MYRASPLHRAALGYAWPTVSRSLSWITGTILWLNHIWFCAECHVTIMSRLSVSLCVTPVWVYGLAASSALLILVPGLDYTSTVECTPITYLAMSIHHLTSVCLLTSERPTGWKKNVLSCDDEPDQSVHFFAVSSPQHFPFFFFYSKMFLHHWHEYKGLFSDVW